MKALSIIFGVLMVIFGIICIFTPMATALSMNVYIVILAAVYGVVGIVYGIANKTYGVGFVFSIISVVFGIAVLFLPNLLLLADAIIIYMVAGWFVVQGFVSIFTSIRVSKVTQSKMWIFQLIFGILGVLLGIYSFFHPMIFGLSVAWIVGILIGAFFIETGFTMIFISSESK